MHFTFLGGLFFIFYFSEYVSICLYYWWNFLLGIEFLVDSFFLLAHSRWCSFFCLLIFEERLFISFMKCGVCLWLLSRFSLSLVLFALPMMCLCIFALFCLFCLLESENLCFSTHLVKFCPLFLQIYFYLIFILFWWGSNCRYIWSWIIFSQITEVCSLFKNIFVFQIGHNLSVPAQLTLWVRSLFFVCGMHFLCIV